MQSNRILAVDGIISVIVTLSKKRPYLMRGETIVGTREIVSIQTLPTPKKYQTEKARRLLGQAA